MPKAIDGSVYTVASSSVRVNFPSWKSSIETAFNIIHEIVKLISNREMRPSPDTMFNRMIMKIPFHSPDSGNDFETPKTLKISKNFVSFIIVTKTIP